MSVSAFSVSETLNWTLTDWLTANANVGYNTSTATRNQVENAITYYNYLGDVQTLVDPIQANSSYKQTSLEQTLLCNRVLERTQNV